MQYVFPNGSIIIIRDGAKRSFLKRLRSTNELLDVKIFELSEFKRKYYFDYSKKTIFYVHKKFDCIPEVAKIYIDNLYYIKEENYSDEKLKFLKSLKDDLTEQGLLEFNPLFKESLTGKAIILYDINVMDNFYNSLFEELAKRSKVIHVDLEENNCGKKELYALEDKNMEVEFVATKICTLLKSGVNIDDIFLANVQEESVAVLKRTFKEFHLPLEIESSLSIASTRIVDLFKKLYSPNVKETLEKLKEHIKTDRDDKIYRMIVGVLNDYTWSDYEEVKDFVFSDIDNLKIPKTKLKHAIKTIDLINEDIPKTAYVFLMGFNQGSFPVNKKDEDYLNDELKKYLGISDSVDLNRKMLKRAKEKIQSTENLIVSYIKRNEQGELYISSAYDENLFIEKNYHEEFNHSNEHNKWEFLKEKDTERMYGLTSSKLKKLESHYVNLPYMTFDNSFKGLNKNKLQEYLKGSLTLSYSTMNNYYLCGFRYYLENILNMSEFENTFEISVGNIFHRVLSLAFNDEFSFEEEWAKAINNEDIEIGYKESFFLEILKNELLFVIDTIREHGNYTALKNAYYEQKITVPISDNVIFKGFVDKILYDTIDGQKIAVVVDYKTGNPELDITNSTYGIGMQLPLYVYLLSVYEPLKDAKIGGFYLEKILNNIKDPVEKKKALSLQGYSNSDIKILEAVDSSYRDSHLVRSLKMTSNGFSAYSKMLSDEEIDKLKELVFDKIKTASVEILNGNFSIDPKEIGGKMYGCKYCKYKDICYMKNADIKKLPAVSKKDFLGGESDAQVD